MAFPSITASALKVPSVSCGNYTSSNYTVAVNTGLCDITSVFCTYLMTYLMSH